MAITKIKVEETEISVILEISGDDYICLTDMARFKDNDSALVISHWMRNLNTIEYLGVWETLHNPNFKPTEFGRFKTEAGYNSFTMSPTKWIKSTDAIGIKTKSGRHGGGTFAHKDIAFNFGMWLSPAFQLYVVKEYQSLVEQVRDPLALQWDAKRVLSKVNYVVHTDAVKDYILPALPETKINQRIIYATEADILNLALFGCTAKDWEEANPLSAQKGMNIRDTATINQLVVMANLESMNAELIKRNMDRTKRLKILRKMAQEQLVSLNTHNAEHKFQKILTAPFDGLVQTKKE